MWQLLVVFSLVGVALAEYDALIQDTMQKVQECKQKTGAQEDIDSLVNNLQIPTSPEGKCMVACVLEEMGLMKGDHVDANAVQSFVKTSVPDLPPTLIMMVTFTVTKCAKSGSGHDKCENATAFLNCMCQAAEANMSMFNAMTGHQ
uniref:Odorant-binding protein 1 n=1 Tax=Matsumurasca onukii TaxID=2912585 RepID=A0A343WGW7_MATON|nr:odorant-binding protein 1 [Matsumurasca onukii]